METSGEQRERESAGGGALNLGSVYHVRRNGAQSIPGGLHPNMYMGWAYMHLSPYTKRKISYTPYTSNSNHPGLEV
jgi:hypothetical protein